MLGIRIRSLSCSSKSDRCFSRYASTRSSAICSHLSETDVVCGQEDPARGSKEALATAGGLAARFRPFRGGSRLSISPLARGGDGPPRLAVVTNAGRCRFPVGVFANQCASLFGSESCPHRVKDYKMKPMAL